MLALRLDLKTLRPLLLKKLDLMTTARADQFRVVITVGVFLRRLVFSVPKGSEHIRMLDVALVKTHEHFIVDFRYPDSAAVVSSRHHRDASPKTLRRIFPPRILDLHTTQTFRILIVCHQAKRDAEDPAAFLLIFSFEQL